MAGGCHGLFSGGQYLNAETNTVTVLRPLAFVDFFRKMNFLIIWPFDHFDRDYGYFNVPDYTFKERGKFARGGGGIEMYLRVINGHTDRPARLTDY